MNFSVYNSLRAYSIHRRRRILWFIFVSDFFSFFRFFPFIYFCFDFCFTQIPFTCFRSAIDYRLAFLRFYLSLSLGSRARQNKNCEIQVTRTHHTVVFGQCVRCLDVCSRWAVTKEARVASTASLCRLADNRHTYSVPVSLYVCLRIKCSSLFENIELFTGIRSHRQATTRSCLSITSNKQWTSVNWYSNELFLSFPFDTISRMSMRRSTDHKTFHAARLVFDFQFLGERLCLCF